MRQMARIKDNITDWRKRRLESPHIIVGCFVLLILAGTLLLLLPVATAEGEKTTFLTAFFTSTTSVCVTGLTVVPTFSHWTLFGQIVILLLIQAGGFGMVTMASFILTLLRRRLSLRFMMLMQDNFNLTTFEGLGNFVRRLVRDTFIVEGLGAGLLMIRLVPRFGAKGVWYSVFHSVSSFCNAGLDLFGNDSLTFIRDDVFFLIVTMALIVLGGLGFVFWFDWLNKSREAIKGRKSPLHFFRKLSENTKGILVMTLVLIVGGAGLVFLLEHDNPATLGGLSGGQKVLQSFFQSVTWRTAGFFTIPQEGLRSATAVIGLLFMFIGGSPVGMAGGVKTMTVLILLTNALAFVRGRKNAVLHKRLISYDLIVKAAAIVTVSLLVTILGSILLLATNDLPVMHVLYEMFSATGTVGLSQGVTPLLNSVGQVIVILSMFLGRIGPITIVLFFEAGRSKRDAVVVAKGNFTVG